MTGYTVHTGSNEKFTEGWDAIFGKAGARKKKNVRPVKSKAAKAKRAGKSKKKK